MVKVSPIAALRRCEHGGYTGSGSMHRVRAIHELPDTRTPNVRDESRWDGRSMFHYACAPSRATVEIWDRILSRA